METFEKLKSRYIFQGDLVLKEAMHVGSGEISEKVDSPFIRTGSSNRFYIPGSSLRGALRSTVERIVHALGQNTCILFDDNPNSECVTAKPGLMTEAEAEAVRRRGAAGWNEPEVVSFLKNGHLCNTCKVFGSPFFASKVRISDLYLKEASDAQSVFRYGIAIDRDTETVSRGALFTVEVLERDLRFDFRMIAENISGVNEWGVLCIGLWEMMRDSEKGGTFSIGANSASGLGRCQLTNLTVKYFDQRDRIYNLENYLLNDEMQTITKECSGSFILEKVKQYLNGGNHNAEEVPQ